MTYRSIRVRLIVSLADVVSAIILVRGLLSYHSRKDELMRQYLSERETTQKRLSINLATPVWNWDLATVDLNMRADLVRAEQAQAEARTLYAGQVTLTAELEESRQLAEASSRSRSEFLANMSHEIRTPMNAIIGLSDLALRLDMSQRLQDYLGKIKNSGEHLLGIINDILDFSKIESGTMEVAQVPLEIDTVLQNVINLVNDKAESKGLELVCSVQPEIPRVLVGDAMRIGQILINLANNAVKFTEHGEARLHMKLRERMEDRLLLYCAMQLRPALKNYPLATMERVTEIKEFSAEAYLVMSKQSAPALVEELKKSMQRVKDSGQYQKILAKHGMRVDR